MIELLYAIIAFILIGYYTIRFCKTLTKKEGSLLKKIWRWIVDIYDSITGIG
jgi:hypothetical protein